MNKKTKRILWATMGLLALVAIAWYLHRTNIPVLEPAGLVGHKERALIIIAILLSVIVVVPVFTMTIIIAWRYRASNTKAKYSPEWDHSRLFEGLWWGVPAAIITVLSVITWQSSHALDPYKALAATTKPLTVQVICLDWKWLFIYPNQNVASVNLVEMPVNTPVDFKITSDAVMNSFWIPQLGGQIYAMPGMSTQLHLVANKYGSFYGSPANIAGSGFSYMNFTAKAVSVQDFNKWVQSAKQSPRHLTQAAYNQLAKPSQSNPVVYYSIVQKDLFASTVLKYMMPAMNGDSSTAKAGNGSNSTKPAISKATSTMQGMYMP